MIGLEITTKSSLIQNLQKTYFPIKLIIIIQTVYPVMMFKIQEKTTFTSISTVYTIKGLLFLVTHLTFKDFNPKLLFLIKGKTTLLLVLDFTILRFNI